MKRIFLLLILVMILFSSMVLAETEEIEKVINFEIGKFDNKETDEDMMAFMFRQDGYFSKNIYNEFTLTYGDMDGDIEDYDVDTHSYSVDWVFYAPLLKNRGLLENNIFLGAGLNYSRAHKNIEVYLPPPYDINIVFDGDFDEYTLPISAVAKAKIREGTFLRIRADYILVGKYSGDIDLEVGPSEGINSVLKPNGDMNGYRFDINISHKINEEVSFVIGYMDKHFTYDKDEDEGMTEDEDGGYDGFYLGCNIALKW